MLVRGLRREMVGGLGGGRIGGWLGLGRGVLLVFIGMDCRWSFELLSQNKGANYLIYY